MNILHKLQCFHYPEAPHYITSPMHLPCHQRTPNLKISSIRLALSVCVTVLVTAFEEHLWKTLVVQPYTLEDMLKAYPDLPYLSSLLFVANCPSPSCYDTREGKQHVNCWFLTTTN